MTDIQPNENMWYPGPDYEGRYEDYADNLMNVSHNRLIELVQKRAKEDGEWAIENGLAGDSEEKMRAMMAWVSREDNIRQCVGHMLKDKLMDKVTVDSVCRELATATHAIFANWHA
jgi:hypothetical protein